jgi:hypothetical protein
MDDDLYDAAIVAFHLLGLGPAGTGPACSRCGRPIEREQFETDGAYEEALGLRLCGECRD